jgi:hypothetical protein
MFEVPNECLFTIDANVSTPKTLGQGPAKKIEIDDGEINDADLEI